MKTHNSIERNAAIYCMLQLANKAMNENKAVLSKLNQLTSKP